MRFGYGQWLTETEVIWMMWVNTVGDVAMLEDAGG
jgi:hypothetical protein